MPHDANCRCPHGRLEAVSEAKPTVETPSAPPVIDGRRWTDGRRWAAGSDSHNLQPLGVPGELTCTGCGIGLIVEGMK